METQIRWSSPSQRSKTRYSFRFIEISWNLYLNEWIDLILGQVSQFCEKNYYFLYHCTLLFGVNCVELGHSSISNKAKRPYWKIMYSFMSPMALQFFCFLKVKMLNPVNFILLCHNGSSIFLFLTHVLFVFLFSTNKRYNSALHKTIKLCFYLSVVQFYFIFSLASRFVVISCYFCSLNGSLI